MKVNFGRDFSDEELRAISGKRKTATRNEVKAWLEALITERLNGAPPAPPAPQGKSVKPNGTLVQSVDSLDKVLEDIYVGRRAYDRTAYLEVGDLMQKIVAQSGVGKG